MMQWEDFHIHVKLCRLAKNGLRSNQKLSVGGGACPQTPLAVVCLCTHCGPDHTKPDGYDPDSLGMHEGRTGEEPAGKNLHGYKATS